MSWRFEWDDPVFRQDDYLADDRLERWTDELLRRFGESPEGRALPDLGISWLDMIFRYALDYEGKAPAEIDSNILELVLLDVFPRKVSMEPAHAGPLVREAEAFFRFAGRELGAEHAEDCRAVLTEELAAEMERKLADPRNFGPAKSFFASGEAAGYDMTSQEGIDAYMLAYNAGLTAGGLGSHGASLPAPGRPSRPQGDRKQKKRKRKLVKKSRRKNR